MSAKDKARYLVNRMLDGQIYGDENPRNAIQCAMICVNEVIAQIEPSVSMDVISARIKYWQEVKKELEAL